MPCGPTAGPSLSSREGALMPDRLPLLLIPMVRDLRDRLDALEGDK